MRQQDIRELRVQQDAMSSHLRRVQMHLEDKIRELSAAEAHIRSLNSMIDEMTHTRAAAAAAAAAHNGGGDGDGDGGDGDGDGDGK